MTQSESIPLLEAARTPRRRSLLLRIFGLLLLEGMPYLIELGILLDLFVGVFVMGIVIFHINREFDHIDSHQLDTLKD